LGAKDWEHIRTVLEEDCKDEGGHGAPLHCSACHGIELSTRLATFNYRKALDFPMFQTSWRDAEDLLRNADEWCFIGYSLPAADFEFKYLLKRTQLSRRRTSGPRVIAVER
jgi:hypothetical protein